MGSRGIPLLAATLLCSVALLAAQDDSSAKKMSAVSCPAFGKPKTRSEPSVQVSALPNCGQWNKGGQNNVAPWHMYLHGPSTSCFAQIVSKNLLVSSGKLLCDEVIADWRSGKTIKIYGGSCVNENDPFKCIKLDTRRNLSRGLLTQKVTNVSVIGPADEEFGYLWTVEDVQFTDYLKPLCLWNGKVAQDASLDFFAHDWDGQIKNTTLLGDEQCVDAERRIFKSHCRHINNSICTENFDGLALLVLQDRRFHLRGLPIFEYASQKVAQLDLAPYVAEIAAH